MVTVCQTSLTFLKDGKLYYKNDLNGIFSSQEEWDLYVDKKDSEVFSQSEPGHLVVSKNHEIL